MDNSLVVLFTLFTLVSFLPVLVIIIGLFRSYRKRKIDQQAKKRRRQFKVIKGNKAI